ncbi:MAG: coniferyl aldehyde dehydrogenase [Gammaproteobacteria bacterium]
MAAEPKSVQEQHEKERMQAMFRAQREAFAAAPMPDGKQRRADLARLKDALIAHQDGFAEAAHQDFGGRSRHETLAELLGSVQGIRYARRHLRRWMRPSRRHAGLLLATTSCKVVYQPKGVIGVIVPWNYPVFLAIGPLTCALAAGNRVMLKMSESAPATAEVMRAMLATAFDENQVGVVLGEVETGKAFSSLAFDHLVFTGSTEVGKHVMRAAAENLTPVTLELGGKSPTLISEDVPMKMAAERICFGKALNAGQTCVAPDYVLCPEGRVDEFITEFSAALHKMYPDMVRNEDYTSVVNERQWSRLQGYLEEARAGGAEVIALSPDGGEANPGSRRMPVHLIRGAKPDMRVMQEEIFGPILPIVPYRSLEQALDYINQRPRPLAINLFDRDSQRRQRILESTHSGGVCVNDAITHFIAEDLPVGGIGDSGMGHYHAHEGFLTFSHHKAVLSRPLINTAKVLYAPHGGWLQKLLYRVFLS